MRYDELINHYRGKKCLVCGASGLTGRNLYNALETLGADVLGTCLMRRPSHTEPMPKFISIDFTDKAQVNRLFYAYSFDYVFICCAQSYNASVCQDDPKRLIQPNLEMTSNILSACHRRRVGKVMYVSSATVYQSSQHALKESELDLNTNPRPLYMGIGWVKRYLEKLCEFYSMQGLHTLVVRPTNIYGKYDKTSLEDCHVVPAFVMRALNGEDPFSVKTRGDGIKNFIYVDDLVRDMLKAMALSESSGVYNLTSDGYLSIQAVCRQIIYLAGQINKGYDPKVVFADIPDAVSFVGIDRTLFDETFGRESYIDINEGLKETVKWYSSLPQTQRR